MTAGLGFASARVREDPAYAVTAGGMGGCSLGGTTVVPGWVGHLLLFGAGASRWVGGAPLLLACLVAFADGFMDWSRDKGSARGSASGMLAWNAATRSPGRCCKTLDPETEV